MVGGQTQFFGSFDQRKICSMGGWQTEKGNMKMDFRRKLSDNEF